MDYKIDISGLKVAILDIYFRLGRTTFLIVPLIS